MKTTKNMYHIDGMKLHKLLFKKNLTFYAMSQAIGYNADYLNKCIRKNIISKQAAQNLEKIYGIRLANYKTNVTNDSTDAIENEKQTETVCKVQQISNGSLAIDGQKLKQFFSKKNIPLAVASRSIGYSNSYINYCMFNGYMSNKAINALERVYKIPYDAYKTENNADTEIENIKDVEEKPDIEKQLRELKNTINSANCDLANRMQLLELKIDALIDLWRN